MCGRLRVGISWRAMGGLVALVIGASHGLAGETSVDFSLKIRPILAEKCFFCIGSA